MSGSIAAMPSLRADRSPKKLNPAIGALIREVRLFRRLSQRDLSAQTLLRPDMLSRYESGIHPPSVRSLVRIAQALRIPVDCLVPELAFEDGVDRELYIFFRHLWFLPAESRGHVATVLGCLFSFNQNPPAPSQRFSGERHGPASGR
jgi:transcriptional regulator with XRE-family HTH domain